MNLSKLLYSFTTLIVGVFFVLLGTIGVLTLWFQQVQEEVVRFIQQNTLFISLFSLSILLIGVGIIVQVILSTRHQHYKILGGKNLATVDEDVLQGYLDSYWKELFPKKGVPNRVYLKNNRIYISADLPYFPSEEQKTLLTKVDKDISKVLGTIFGYNQEFSLQISFNEAQ